VCTTFQLPKIAGDTEQKEEKAAASREMKHFCHTLKYFPQIH
jgi:hypothetical protein